MRETQVVIPGLGRSPGEGKGYPPQYSSLENSIQLMGVPKSWTLLCKLHFHFSLFSQYSNVSLLKNMFHLNNNLLTNPVILKCILWECVW